MKKLNEKLLHWMQEAAQPLGRPIIVALVVAYGLAWFATQRGNIGWDGWATIAGLILVIIIQASQNRDSKALHSKIDELILAMEEADSSFAQAEKLSEREIDEKQHQSTPK